MEKIKIFNAASLFNGRENLFNILLVEKLEELGYKVFSAQRDGFEFSKLNEALKGKIPSGNFDKAGSNIIYLWDIGWNLPNCDIVLANMDEPLDPGVDIEQAYGKLMGKFIIGFRTDVRSPYGSIEDSWGGMHYFPGYQCDVFFRQDMLLKTKGEAIKIIDELAKKIDKIIKEKRIDNTDKKTVENPVVVRAIERANKLFSGIQDIHSDEGLTEIARRYSEKSGYFSVEIVKT